MFVCSMCGEEVTPALTYQRIVGWERKGKSQSRKGGSDIVLREHRDEFACMTCITRIRSGINTAQESLV